MPSSGNKKSTKNTPNKNSKENPSVITIEKIEEMLEQKSKSYEENIKSYLAATNKLLSQRIDELNGKLTDFQVSIEQSGEVILEKVKAIDRDMSHINANFKNEAKTIIYTK